MATTIRASVPTKVTAAASGRPGKAAVLSARPAAALGGSLRVPAPAARSARSMSICASAPGGEASPIIAGQGTPVMVPRTQEMGGDPFGLLLKKRIVFLGSQVDDFTADAVISQLLLLDAQNPEEDIQLFINSPGGSVTAGMGIYDAMQMCRADVSTVCFGLAASMGAFLLNAGAKGKRYAMPNARIMIHQPLGGASGNAVDIEIQAREIMYHKANLNRLISFHCGVPVEQVDEDTDRDRYMSPLEAKDYGLIDHIIGGDEAVMKVEGDVEAFGKTKKEYIAWWKDAEQDGGDSGGGFSGKPIEPYMPTPTTPSTSE